MKTLAKILPIFMVLLPLAASAESSMYGSANGQVKVEVEPVSAEVHVSGSAGTQGSAPAGTIKNDDSMHAEDSMKLDASRSSDDESMETEIQGDPDFDLIVKTAKEDDVNVAAADVNADGAVEVEYKHEGHLFGLIPVTLKSKTSVSSDAEGMAVVKVSLPWWSFLVSDASELRTAIEASLAADTDLQASAKANSHAEVAHIVLSALSKIKPSYDIKMMTK